MAKSLSLQLKEALEQGDALRAQLESIKIDRDELGCTKETQSAELVEAKQTITDLNELVESLRTRDQELSHDLANATAEVQRLKAEAKTVSETAAQEAQRIVADIGVPAVDADSEAKPGTAQSVEDLMTEYQELLKTDTRAAGQFYHSKLAPALRKKD